MDQNSVPGQPALAPPDAGVAQRYLVQADAVASRRDQVVDRRAQAWLVIANGAITAVYLVAFSVLVRQENGLAPQLVLFTFLLWAQLSNGMAQRNGMQWRLTASRSPVIVAAALMMIAALVLFGFAVWAASPTPLLMLAPGAIVLVGLGGYGVIQLVRASRDPEPPRSPRRPMPRELRVGTTLVGVAIGSLTALGGAPDGVLATVMILLIVLMLVVWIVAARSAMGLPAIGAAWRWPHIVTFALSALTLLSVVLTDGGSRATGMVVSGIAGLCVVAVFAAVSFVPGRGRRE